MMNSEKTKRMPNPSGILKKLLWLGLTLGLVLGLLAGGWIYWFRTYTPVAVAQDLRAAFKARNSSQPALRFLEARYGSMSDPANRQKAFLDFFDLDHMEGLHRIVSHIPSARKNNAIDGMAQWVADYRNTMTPAEKDNLRACLQSDAGRSVLRQATAQYLQHDVRYRGATAPVIAELMATLTAIQQP